jgi:hypothetical protein
MKPRTGLASAFVVLAVTGCGSLAPKVAQPSASTAPAAAGSLCDNQYYPVKKGATWTYTLHTSITTSTTETDTIASIGPDSFTTKHDTGAGTPWTQAWTCTKDGLVQLLNKGGPLSAFVQGDDGAATVTTKSNTGVTVPREFKTGDTWTQSAELFITGGQVSATVKFKSSFTAVGLEWVTVPAGTFDAIRIDGTTQSLVTFQNQTSMTTATGLRTWLVPGEGTVRTIGWNDISDNKIDLESDLVSYSIQ